MDLKNILEKEVERHRNTQRVLNELLSLSLSDDSLDDILQHFINLLTSLPWLELEAKGAVFLVDSESPRLLLQAQKELAVPLLSKCQVVNFGHCLCGRAAASGEIIFADHVDDNHDTTFEGMAPHGHYCVPIFSAEHKLLGVFTLYTKDGASRNPETIETFQAAARVIAAIIKRKQMEKQLTDKQIRLEKAKREAEVASKAKSDFISAMSHELYTPMNGIIGFTDILMAMQKDKTQKEYLGFIKESSGRLMHLINQIINYSSISSEGISLKKERFNLFQVLQSTLSLFITKMDDKKLDFHLSVSDEIPPELFGYKNVLTDILTNLIENSIEFTEQGSIVLSIKPRESGKENSITLQFSFCDTGIGIAEEKQEDIFAAFTQVDEYLTRRHQGAGLGLAICSKLVKILKGELWVESELDKGSTFHFTAQFTKT